MKDTKRRFETFSFYDHTGIEAHLERMAAKGWLLDKITGLGWRYRRTTPKQMHFAVTYYPPASAFDPLPSDGEQTFQDFCAEAGWSLAASSAQLQIFYNERENPVPIETDAALQVKTIRRAVNKGFLPGYIIMLLIGLLNGILFCVRLWHDPISVLASSANLFTGLCWTALVILSLSELTSFFLWYRRAKAAALSDSFIETNGSRHLQSAVLGVVLVAALYWLVSLGSGNNRELLLGLLSLLYIAVLLFLVNTVKNLLKRKRVAAGVNLTVTIISSFMLSFVMMGGLVFFTMQAVSNGWLVREASPTYGVNGFTWNVYDDRLPLTVEDMRTVDYDDYFYGWTTRKSLLLTQFEARQRAQLGTAGIPNLSYTITKIKMPALYDFSVQGLLRKHTDNDIGYRFMEQDASLWQADTVYQLYSGDHPLDWYLVCWPDKILEITFYWEAPPEQIATAAKILGTV